jgi:hypothetical protein
MVFAIVVQLVRAGHDVACPPPPRLSLDQRRRPRMKWCSRKPAAQPGVPLTSDL